MRLGGWDGSKPAHTLREGGTSAVVSRQFEMWVGWKGGAMRFELRRALRSYTSLYTTHLLTSMFRAPSILFPSHWGRQTRGRSIQLRSRSPV